MEGLCSPEATPNLDVVSRGPNHTTTLLLLEWTLIRIRPIEEILKELEKTKMKKKSEDSLVQLKSKFR